MEGRGSTTELHPHELFFNNIIIIHLYLIIVKIFLVERAGFEPAKALPTDLQSAPFSHSGTSPYEIGDPEGARTLDLQRDRLAF